MLQAILSVSLKFVFQPRRIADAEIMQSPAQMKMGRNFVSP
jgi:hypothetical protein